MTETRISQKKGCLEWQKWTGPNVCKKWSIVIKSRKPNCKKSGQQVVLKTWVFDNFLILKHILGVKDSTRTLKKNL